MQILLSAILIVIRATVLLAMTSISIYAASATPLAQDPIVEQRLISISEELRCLVCQNESLAGSRADLAQDLRREVRHLIQQGRTDIEIKEFLVSRYGDFVLYRPPLKSSTWLLWLGPFVLLLFGIAVLWWHLKKRVITPAAPLSAQERARVDQLLTTHSGVKSDKNTQETV